MKTFEQLLEIAGIKDIDNAMKILNEEDLHSILYKIDKWMPADPELQKEFYEISDPQELADFLENNADEGELHRFGFRGNWLALANLELANRK